MAKRENYMSALVAVLDSHDRLPHAWGTSDCLMRCGEAVAAIMKDPAKIIETMDRYRGKYSSYAEAVALLKADGFDSPADLMASLFGPYRHHSRGHDGDIGAFYIRKQWAFGVICGPHLFVTAEEGRAILPRDTATRVYEV